MLAPSGLLLVLFVKPAESFCSLLGSSLALPAAQPPLPSLKPGLAALLVLPPLGGAALYGPEGILNGFVQLAVGTTRGFAAVAESPGLSERPPNRCH